jgi:hypothetical protein
MFIYNVTIKIDWTIHEEWRLWLVEENIPGMMETGCFLNYQLVKILEVDEVDGPTYAIQYYVEEIVDYERFIIEYGQRFASRSRLKWGEQMLQFSTLMEVIN